MAVSADPLTTPTHTHAVTPAVTTTKKRFDTFLVEPTMEVEDENGTELVETTRMQARRKKGRGGQKKATGDVWTPGTPFA